MISSILRGNWGRKLSTIELADTTKKEIVGKLQQYFNDELQQEIGSFDAEFLLDFFAEQVGNYYYNQGLADALKTFESRLEDISDGIYQLEKENPLELAKKPIEV